MGTKSRHSFPKLGKKTERPSLARPDYNPKGNREVTGKTNQYIYNFFALILT